LILGSILVKKLSFASVIDKFSSFLLCHNHRSCSLLSKTASNLHRQTAVHATAIPNESPNWLTVHIALK
jgi:hypothetical protein